MMDWCHFLWAPGKATDQGRICGRANHLPHELRQKEEEGNRSVNTWTFGGTSLNYSSWVTERPR